MTDFVAETTDATAASAATTTPAAPEITVTTAPKHKPIFFSRFTMRAPLVVGGQARPDIESLMMFGIYRENPRITVKTNDPGDEQNSYGKITGAMDPVTWGVLMQHIKDLIKNPVKDIKVIDNLNNYKGGQKFDEPQHINRTLVGRDDDGRIWIKLLEEGRPSPTFYFGPPKYHNLIRMDKTPVPAGDFWTAQLYDITLPRVRGFDCRWASVRAPRQQLQSHGREARHADCSSQGSLYRCQHPVC